MGYAKKITSTDIFAKLAKGECANYVNGGCQGRTVCAVAEGDTCEYFNKYVKPLLEDPDVSGRYARQAKISLALKPNSKVTRKRRQAQEPRLPVEASEPAQARKSKAARTRPAPVPAPPAATPRRVAATRAQKPKVVEPPRATSTGQSSTQLALDLEDHRRNKKATPQPEKRNTKAARRVAAVKVASVKADLATPPAAAADKDSAKASAKTRAASSKRAATAKKTGAKTTAKKTAPKAAKAAVVKSTPAEAKNRAASTTKSGEKAEVIKKIASATAKQTKAVATAAKTKSRPVKKTTTTAKKTVAVEPKPASQAKVAAKQATPAKKATAAKRATGPAVNTRPAVRSNGGASGRKTTRTPNPDEAVITRVTVDGDLVVRPRNARKPARKK